MPVKTPSNTNILTITMPKKPRIIEKGLSSARRALPVFGYMTAMTRQLLHEGNGLQIKAVNANEPLKNFI